MERLRTFSLSHGIMMARHDSKEVELAEATKEAVLGVEWTGKKTNQNVYSDD